MTDILRDDFLTEYLLRYLKSGKIIAVVMFCTWLWKCFQIVVTVRMELFSFFSFFLSFFVFKTTLLKEMEK